VTLVEFLAPLKNGKHEDRVRAVLYYCERYEQRPSMTADQIRKRLKDARAPGAAKVNVPDVLTKSGERANTDGVEGGRRLWLLTETGHEHVRSLLGLPASEPEIEHDVATLSALVAKVPDGDVRDYLEEALKCLRVGALRACVVFIWTAAAREIQTSMMAKGPSAVTAAVQKHDPKARSINKIDDFAYVKEAVQLLAALGLGLLDKSEKDTLEEALDLRNRCGHPSKYKPGAKKVSAFVEDVTSILFA
jgi:hypothetical protein